MGDSFLLRHQGLGSCSSRVHWSTKILRKIHDRSLLYPTVGRLKRTWLAQHAEPKRPCKLESLWQKNSHRNCLIFFSSYNIMLLIVPQITVKEKLCPK
ncbi:hypothetical protein T03_9442 [Trichinella britovi]|uniref:Uncharacterized protein n=1 Tax=Trichinella britovi TaxID=45882 RepID=A0A0V1CZL1_TRIBR|nr:hypothetical protein T03_9442 [Trichinella britovi]